MTEVLDISETVTREQYTQVLRSLLDQFENWRNERGWCTDLYYYVGQLSRTFKWNPDARGVYPEYDGEMTISIPDDRTGEEMAADLRDIRGRVLRFTINMSDTLSVAKAHEFLSHSGLPPYEHAPRVNVEIDGRVTTTLTREEIAERFTGFLAALGEDAQVGGVYVNSERSGIAMADTVALLPRT